LLLVQAGLAVGINLRADHYSGFKSDTPLLALASQPVDGVLIEDGDGNQVQLVKQGARWVLPQADGFPADDGRVNGLLTQLEALKTSWPVASTSSAAERFKVGDDNFERRLTLRHGDAVLARLYVGSSPAYRKVNARVDGEDNIYTVALETFAVPAKVDDWEDKSLLTLKAADINRVELPGVSLQRVGDGLEVEQLGVGEQTAGAESAALLQRIANLAYTASAGKSDQAGSAKSDAVFEFSLTLNADAKRDYRFTQVPGAKDYLLKSSDQPWVFRVAPYTLDNIRSATRSRLVRAPATSSPAASKPDDASSAGSS
jgi:hypothetical protein